MKENEEGFSMPLAAPAFTQPSFQAMADGKLLLMIFEASRNAIAYEVPEPLRPSDDNLCLAWIGDMRQPTHTIDVYHECLTAIKTKYKRWTGWYINYLWVSHDIALTFPESLWLVCATVRGHPVEVRRKSDFWGVQIWRKVDADERQYHQSSRPWSEETS